MLLSIGLIFSQVPPDCTESVLTLSGALFDTSTEPLCPDPFCHDFEWSVDIMEMENSGREFAKIEFEIIKPDDIPVGSACPGSFLSSTMPMGTSSAIFEEDATFRATIFFIDPDDPNSQPTERTHCKREINFEVINYNQIFQPLEGTSSLSEVVGAHSVSVSVTGLESNIYDPTDIFWTTENETDGSYSITTVSSTSTGSSATVMLDDFSNGDIVAYVIDKCGTQLEVIRFNVSRFCPDISFTGQFSSCQPTWCGDEEETFSYNVTASPPTTLDLNYEVVFSQLNVISTSSNVTQNNIPGSTILNASGDFSFELQPPAVTNSNYQITMSYSAGDGTSNACSETQVTNIYSGLINGIDISLNVHSSSPGAVISPVQVGTGGFELPRGPRDSFSSILCRGRNNYIEADYYGEGDACILDWEWQVPSGWSIQFPDYPDKSVALVIPNSSYGDIYISAENECGWSSPISYGFYTRSCGWYKTSLGQTDVEFYPNPILRGSTLNMDITASERESFISIYSSSGDLVQSDSIEPNTSYYSLRLKDSSPGLYWINFQSVHGNFSQKLVIK